MVIPLSPRDEDTAQFCESRLKQAIDRFEQGRQTEAHALITEALERMSMQLDAVPTMLRARLLGADASLKHGSGDLNGARQAFEAAERIWAAHPGEDHRCQHAVFLMNFGNLLYDLGELESARDRLKQALDLDLVADSAGTGRAVALDRLNLARVFTGAGDTSRAIELAELGLASVRASAPDRVHYRTEALAILGNAYLAAGKPAEALTAYESEVDAATRSGDPRAEAMALNNLGTALYAIGDFEAALEGQRRAAELLKVFGDREDLRDSIQIEMNVGAALHKLERFADALEYAERVTDELAALTPPAPPWLLITVRKNAGSALLRLGRYAEARVQFNLAFTIATAAYGRDHPQVGDVLFHIGETCYRDDSPAEALAYALDALVVLSGRIALDLHWRIFDLLSRIAADREMEKSAILFGKLAADLIQQTRIDISPLGAQKQDTYVTSRSAAFRGLAGFLVGTGRIAEAEDVLKRLRDEDQLALFHERSDTASRFTRLDFTSLEDDWRNRYDGLVDVRKTLLAEIDRLTHLQSLERDESAKLAELRSGIAENASQLRDWSANAERILEQEHLRPNVAATGRSLDRFAAPNLDIEDTAVLIAVPTRTRLSLVLKDRHGEVLRKQVAIEEVELNHLVFELRKTLASPRSPMSIVHSQAQALFQVLIDPVEQALLDSGVRTLVFWLNGGLRLVPPAALYDGQRFLLERWSPVLYSPHAAVAGHARAQDRVAGFATTRGSEGLTPLWHAEREINSIVRETEDGPGLLPGHRFLNEAFTSESLADAASSDYSILHIASHFVLRPATPGLSGLLLGTGKMMRLVDIKSMNLRGVDKMVLSCCDTATATSGEEHGHLLSMADYLLSGGVRTVLASLWGVADGSTADLMIAFYSFLANVYHDDAPQALRNAQLAFLAGAETQGPHDDALRGIGGFDTQDGRRHPYYWSPFVLIGAPR
jgi:CHAT domain-containing protein/Tfp pilus assembly protein PilF